MGRGATVTIVVMSRFRELHPNSSIAFGWTGRKSNLGAKPLDNEPATDVASVLILCRYLVKLPFSRRNEQMLIWLDRQDSNLRMLGPKPSALPLGDGPLSIIIAQKWWFGVEK